MTIEEHRELTDAATAFARSDLAPAIAALDDDGPVVRTILARAAERGLFSVCAPEGRGGLGLDADALAVVLVPIARASAGIAGALLVQAGAQWLLGPAWPEAIDGADALAFPAHDDPRALRVALDGDPPRATATLGLVPAAARARYLVVSGRMAGSDHTAVAACALATLEPSPVRVLGLRAMGPADVRLAAAPCVHVAPNARLDDVAARLALGVAAIALGLVEGCLATALDYARERVQGGRAIVQWGEVQRLLGIIEQDASTLDSALRGALAAFQRREPGWRTRAHHLALRATELACRSTSDGVQILGGNGYMIDYPQERRMRDARQLRALLGPAPERLRRTIAARLAGDA